MRQWVFWYHNKWEGWKKEGDEGKQSWGKLMGFSWEVKSHRHPGEAVLKSCYGTYC